MEQVGGVFYGVSVGPGDPELLTRKAVSILERCPVIAAPRTRSGRMLALEIAKQAADLGEKTILPLYFTMHPSARERTAAHREAAALIAEHLSAGRDVAMLNLGDVSIYATWHYLARIVSGQGFTCVMVPGVPSFCAAAARLGVSLTEADQPLHILPADSGVSDARLRAELALPGTKVLMKAGKSLARVAEILRSAGVPEEGASMVSLCDLPGEEIFMSAGDFPDSAGYFSTVIIRAGGAPDELRARGGGA